MRNWICIAASVTAMGMGAGTAAWAQTSQSEILARELATVAANARIAQVDRVQVEAAFEALATAQQRTYSVRAYMGNSEQALYSQASAAADESRWDRALALYAQVIALKGERVDAAMYWKAYVQNKLGQQSEALATIQQLLKDFAKSRWILDAKALEVEVRGASGQPVRPEAESDDDLKLLALNGLMNNDADQAIGIIQKLLQGPQSHKIKQRALFVLSQNKSAKARDLLLSIAKGSSNPDLQRDALSYYGMFRSSENRQLLAEIYASTSEADIKRQILSALTMVGDLDHVTQIAKTEADAKIRLEAVRSLGMMGKDKSAATLAEIYAAAGQTIEVRREVINALALQSNASVLVSLARKETNLELKKALVQRLAMMKSKEATDYLMELINK